MESNTPKAIALMCFAGLIIGISSVILKASGDGIPSMECAFFRVVVGFVFLLAMSASGIRKTPIGSRKGLLFLRGFLGAVASMAYVWAIPRMDLALANGLNQTSPIFVCIFAAIFLGERFRWWIYALVLMAFVGIAIVIRPDVSGFNIAAIIAVSSAVFSGLAYTCVRKLQKTESSETIVMWFMGVSTLLTPVTALGEPWVMPVGWQLFGLVMVGVTTLIGQIFMTRAYRYAPATIVAPFIYVSTFSTLVIAFLLWGEMPDALTLVGCGIVITSAILIGILPNQRKQSLTS